MNAIQNTPSRYVQPDISFIMPCYNEEESVGYSVPRLAVAFEKAGHRLQLIAVDNGSTDRTGEVIKKLASSYPNIVPHTVAKNEGYGNGVLSAIQLCTAPWIGIIPADGQVDAADVVQLYEAVLTTNGNVLAKARRRFRMDGSLRKVVSVTYNLLVLLLWPRLGSIDVNGSPKILTREALAAMQLESKEWFLDPEIMIKAHYMGIRVMEFNVFARMRGNGLSHVRASACWEFFWKLISYRFSSKLSSWRKKSIDPGIEAGNPANPYLERTAGGREVKASG